METRPEIMDSVLYADKGYKKIYNVFNEMILIKYPIPVIIVALYILAVWRGPRWMEARPALKLKTVLRIYNACQIVFNLIMLIPIIYSPSMVPVLYLRSCEFTPEDVDIILSDTFHPEKSAYFFLSWWFMVVKMTDLLDTIFMVLTKKNSHITFLHVYHHVSMVLFTWMTFKDRLGLQSIIPAMINAFIHIIMYSYFFLSTFGPSVQKYLSWKRHLTKLQIGQFVAVMTYISMLYFDGCTVSRLYIYMWFCNVTIILGFFINFYIQSYLVKANSNSVSNKNK